jgi:predicted ABC-type ATPase
MSERIQAAEPPDTRPRVVILAGPNGAGKSTTAEEVLRGPLQVEEFVNADVIAQGLSGFAPERVAFESGRIMLARMRALAAKRASFAFETTLASRSFVPWLAKLSAGGYQVHLVFLWLASPEIANARVAERVRRGGHHVPEPVVRRRYFAGIRNFFALYQPLADSWQIINNTATLPTNVAEGSRDSAVSIRDPISWAAILRAASNE